MECHPRVLKPCWTYVGWRKCVGRNWNTPLKPVISMSWRESGWTTWEWEQKTTGNPVTRISSLFWTGARFFSNNVGVAPNWKTKQFRETSSIWIVMSFGIHHLERKMIFQTSMIMFHVNLPGCRDFEKQPTINLDFFFEISCLTCPNSHGFSRVFCCLASFLKHKLHTTHLCVEETPATWMAAGGKNGVDTWNDRGDSLEGKMFIWHFYC